MSGEFSKKDNVNKKSAYLWGAIIGVLATVAAMLVFSAVLLFLNIDRAYAAPFATISVAIGCFCAGRHTAKKIGDKGYLIGLIIGAVVFVVITALSLIMGNSLSLNTLFHFIIMMLASIVGGIMGVNRNKHKKYI
ncbi:MAG: TIGR04086 family membrane protein [Clostridia bacterium]|nr:TIGR04086 family membrane protein [Clostridia bacterium]